MSWHDKGAALRPDSRAVTAGQRLGAASGETLEKHSPIDPAPGE